MGSNFSRFAMLLVVAVSVLLPQQGFARKFDMATETFATYFGGGYGPSLVSDYMFGRSSGIGVQTDQIVGSNYSGEIGVLLALKGFNVRLGGEYLIAKSLEGIKGRVNDVEYFSLSSKLSALTPKISIERAFWKRLETRLSLGGGAGMATVSTEQVYTLTTAGTTALGVTDYIEKGTASVIMWNAYLVGETLLVDTTTVAIELGYRSLKVGTLTSQGAANTITGAQTAGSTLINSDGSGRSFDLGGAYANLYFRFFL